MANLLQTKKRRLVAAVVLVATVLMFALGNSSALLPDAGVVQDGNSLSMGPADYDSGWVDITNQRGKTFQITHNLGTREIMVDITGKTKPDGSPHQENLGATSQSLRWWKTYGGTNEDNAKCVIQTSDGGYAIAGYTKSFGAGGSDFWLLKTDSVGNVMWSKTYGGLMDDDAECVIQTSDGGYAIAGSTKSIGAGGSDFWLVKTDPSGNMQWNRPYGGLQNDDAECVIQTSDGGYAIVGGTFSRGIQGSAFWLVKTDISGNKVWDFAYDKAYAWSMAAVSVVQTVPDGGYAIVGNYMSEGPTISELVKITSNGVFQWAAGVNSNGAAESLIQTVEGGYAVAGYDVQWMGIQSAAAWLVKYDSNANKMWKTPFGLKIVDPDAPLIGQAYSVVQTSDGGYAVAYYAYYYGLHEGSCIIKMSYNGDIEWDRNLVAGKVVSIAKAIDVGFVFAGTQDNDFLVVKTDASGYLQGPDMGLSWVASSDNTLTLYRGSTDLYWNFVRVRIWTLAQAKLNTVLSFSFTPNPAKTGQTVTLSGTLKDVNNIAVYPAQVKVEYSVNGGASWNLIWNLNTNAAGAFSQSFTAPGAGTYLVRASYAGSTTYNPSSNTQTLTINP